jgi:hypothetical protein
MLSILLMKYLNMQLAAGNWGLAIGCWQLALFVGQL